MAAEPEPDLKLEIAHVLTIDVVAYSTRLIHEQSQVMSDLNKAVRNTPRFRAAEAAGALTRLPTGDGMSLVFHGDPEAPIECAMQIAKALQEHPEIRVRMGIHSGPINQVTDVNDRSNVAGAGIDLAQRVMDCGDGGHILVSKRVADDLAPYAKWHQHLHELGECEVKHGRKLSVCNFYTHEVGNSVMPQKFRKPEGRSWVSRIESTIRSFGWGKLLWRVAILFAVAAIGLLWPILRPRPGGTGEKTFAPTLEKSVAIMPFENRSEDKRNAYFTEGVQDEILTRLSKIADLRVISRTSTQLYKASPENLPAIARQLGVAYIVEGSVQTNGDAVRVNVQLLKGADDSHVWADTFDRKLTDIFIVESEVARAIADQLGARLTGHEATIIASKPTTNAAAHDAYLRGLAYTQKGANTRANSLGAQKYLREAVRLDPKFTLSWALLSYNNAIAYVSATLEPTEMLREETRQAAETALNLEPNLGEALLAKGYYHYACLKDYDAAEDYFEKARSSLPNSSQIPQAMAYVARRRGNWTRSEAFFADAERLDPRNVTLLTQEALTYVAQRRFAEARAKFDQVLDIIPDDPNTVGAKVTVAQAQGDLAGAAALLLGIPSTVSNPAMLETRAYQAILERRPHRIIPQLENALQNPDLGFEDSITKLRFWLAWALAVSGDNLRARETWLQTRAELEASLKEQPENFGLIGDLALTNACLGEMTSAHSLCERAMDVITIEKDALVGPVPVEILARVTALEGDLDRSLPALEKLISIPYSGPLPQNMPITRALLRLDPMFDRLRGNRRFQQLTESASP